MLRPSNLIDCRGDVTAIRAPPPDSDLSGAVLRLGLLHAAPGRVFPRQQLLDHLHDDDRAVTDRVTDSHVRNLRRELATFAQGHDPIRSVYGVGYAFEWPA